MHYPSRIYNILWYIGIPVQETANCPKDYYILTDQKTDNVPYIDLNDPKINPDLERIHVASHPTRIRILHSLLDGRNYAAKLAQELQIERKVVAFHLAELYKVDLVKGRYALNQDKRPGAVKYYELTDKGKEIYEHIIS
jgi:DNA-binding transcriptional ArsR family regulator